MILKLQLILKSLDGVFKKYCKGNKHNIFIYDKINNKKTCVNINRISKMSDLFKLIH